MNEAGSFETWSHSFVVSILKEFSIMTYGELLNWLKSKDEYSYIIFNISSTARFYYAHIARGHLRDTMKIDEHGTTIVGNAGMSAKIYGYSYTNDEEDVVHIGDLVEIIKMMAKEYGEDILDSDVQISLEDDDYKDYRPAKVVKVDEDLYVMKIN